jgi:hypothetical protein
MQDDLEYTLMNKLRREKRSTGVSRDLCGMNFWWRHPDCKFGQRECFALCHLDARLQGQRDA